MPRQGHRAVVASLPSWDDVWHLSVQPNAFPHDENEEDFQPMTMPALFKGRLSIPVIGSPLFIISVPDLVIAQCKAGIVGSFPSLNARPQALLDEWLARIKEELAAHDRAHPERPSAPFAVNQIVHRSNNRLEHDLALCEKHKVPMVITSLGAREELNQAAHQLGRHRVSRRDQSEVRAQGDREGRRRTDPGGRGRRRPCRHAFRRSRSWRRPGNGSTGPSRCPVRSATAAPSARRGCSARTSPISARPSSPPRRPMRSRPTSR